MREKRKMDEDAMRWYFIEYISNNCDMDDLRRADFDKAVDGCYGEPEETDREVLYDLFILAGYSVAQP